MKKSKYKVTFYLINQTYGLKVILKKLIFGLENKYTFKITKNEKKSYKSRYCISFILYKSFAKNFERNKLVLIVHPSKLPKDKGHTYTASNTKK